MGSCHPITEYFTGPASPLVICTHRRLKDAVKHKKAEDMRVFLFSFVSVVFVFFTHNAIRPRPLPRPPTEGTLTTRTSVEGGRNMSSFSGDPVV